MRTQMPTLDCCPFCGKSPRWHVSVAKDDNQYWSIVCDDSKCYANLVSSAVPEGDSEELANKWNTRKGGK